MHFDRLSFIQYIHNLPQDSPERAVLNNVVSLIVRRPSRSELSETIPNELRMTPLDLLRYNNRKLGAGGFASVFEGDWIGTKVAVKVMRRNISQSVCFVLAYNDRKILT